MATTQQYLEKLIEDKNTLKQAFSERGIEVSDGDNFSTLASKSSNLPTGGGGGDISEYINDKPTETDTYAYNQLYKFVKKLPTIDLSDMNISPANMFNKFNGETLKIKSSYVYNHASHNNMFSGCPNLKSVDLSEYDGSSANNLASMFLSCPNLETANLSTFSGAVTDLSAIFNGCSKLTSVNLTNLNTSNCTMMQNMFYGCSLLETIDLSNFDTRKATTTNQMFRSCTNLKNLITGNNWIFDANKNFGFMFYECRELESVDLSATNNSVVTSIGSMFYNCKKLKTVDISGFSFDKMSTTTTNISNMFYGCSALETVYVKDASAKAYIDGRLSNSRLSITSTIKGE